MTGRFLVRYGSVPEVAKFIYTGEEHPQRETRVVVRTHRGLQLGSVLEEITKSVVNPEDHETDWEIVRLATPEDLAQAQLYQAESEAEFFAWCRRILLWNLPLELVDLERTLDDGKIILYVLAERGPATTTLALQAAAEGLGVIEVQPVSSLGIVSLNTGGCGTGGCGCHS